LLAWAAPAKAVSVTFISASDSHYCDPDDLNDRERAILATMNNVTARTLGGAAIDPPRGVLFAGDLLNGGTTTQWNNWVRDFGLTGGDGAVLKYPVYETYGGSGHDGTVTLNGIIARSGNRFGLTSFDTATGDCSWDWGGVHFVSAGIRAANADLTWLQYDLATNVGASGRPVVLLEHEDWNNLDPALYENLLKYYNVVAMVNGHESAGVDLWHGITVLDSNNFTNGYYVVQIDGTTLKAARTTGGSGNLTPAVSKTITIPTCLATWTALTGGSWDTPATITLDGARTVSGNHEIAAPVTLNNDAAVAVHPNSQLTISGAIDGVGKGLAKGGAGTLILARSCTCAGTTTISAGTLQVGADGTSGSVNDFTLSGAISGPGAVTKAGANVVTFGGANIHTGGTTISGGTLKMGNSGALCFGAPVGLGASLPQTTVSGTLDLNGKTFGGQFTLAGGSLINSSGSRATVESLAGLTLSNGGTGISGGATIALSGGGGSGATATASLGLTAASITFTNPGREYVVGDILHVTGGGGTDALIKVTGLGTSGAIATWNLMAPGSGYTSAPTGVVGGGGGAGVNGRNATITGNADNFQVVSLSTTTPGSGYTSPPTISISSGSGFAATAVLSSLNLTATSSIGGSGDIAIPAVITGGFGFNKIGAGTLTLAGSNTYTGATSIAGGTLSISANANLGADAAPVSISNGATLKVTDNATLNSSRKLTIDSTSGALDVANGKTLTISGLTAVMADATLAKLGGGVAELAGGLETHTAPKLSIQAGTLRLKDTAVISTTLAIATTTGSTFEVASSTHSVGTITGTGTTAVQTGANLTADLILQDTLTIGAAATLTIRPTAAGAGEANLSQVPEPSTWLLLATAGAALGAYLCCRRR
jgi:autotransporter-associated beta strand protein